MDTFEHYAKGLQSPPSNAFSVTPNDSTDLSNTTRALNVAVSGDVQVDTEGGDTVTLYIAAGAAFPVRATRVYATDTTATGIVGLY